MFTNYFKIAWRNLSRNKGYAIINVIGLSIGIACCILMLLWVAHELSYDRWNSKADRTYRVAAVINFGGKLQEFAVGPAPLAAALARDFPEVEHAVKFRDYGSSLVKRDVENFTEEDIIFVDSTIFDVFDLQILEGSKSALAAPNTIVISRSAAKKYFPEGYPLGKTLTFDDRTSYEVTAVIEDMPVNSHFRYDFFVSLTGGQEANNGIWVSHNFPTYFVLREDADPLAFEAKMFPHLLETYIAPQIELAMGVTYEEMIQSGAYLRYYLQPMTSIHLHSDLVAELAPNGSILYIWIFLTAALFILIIACVNFMNLTTAQSSLRSKEIGLRKVMGSMRSHLIRQFLSESILLSFVALLIGLIFVQLALPSFNVLAEKSLTIPYHNPLFWALILGGTLVTGLLAGSYPAFYLSGFRPIEALNGRKGQSPRSSNLRNALVVFQFMVAVLLIIGTLGIQKQMQFIKSKKLGFERDQILVIDDAYALKKNQKAFKNQMVNHPDVRSASFSSYLPVPSSRSDSPLCKSGEIREDNCVSMQIWDVDEDYISTMGMQLASGRDFRSELPTDSLAVIINQTAAKLFGFDDPLDQTIYGNQNFDPNTPSNLIPLKIIGVVEDFHYESLRENIRALCFILSPSSGSLSIKLAGDNVDEVIALAQRTWKEMAPDQPFSYSFMDESFDQMYITELRVTRLLRIFSGLAIFIACLGLLGLAAFATEQRTREIGVRKVLGASTIGLVGLLSKDFLRLVVVSLVIAIPLAWYMMNQWLANFAYSASLDVSLFVIAGIMAILIALLTVSFHAVRSALSNPIDALRSE